MKIIRHISQLIVIALWIFVPCQYARAQAVSDWIESSGLGPSEEKATMEALRSAIQQVVGVFIDAETIVANEDVIKDQILDYSAGYIEDYERISTTPKDGLIEVRLRAKVKRERLEARIKDVIVVEKKIDGQKLFDIAAASAEKETDAAKLLLDVGREFPEKAVDFKLGKPEVRRTLPDGKIEFSLKVEYTLRPEFVSRLQKALSAVSIRKGMFNSLAQIASPGCDNTSSDTDCLELPRYTGVAISDGGRIQFYQLTPDRYWALLAAILTGSDWLPSCGNKQMNRFGEPREGLFDANMPFVRIEILDGADTYLGELEIEAFNACSLLSKDDTSWAGWRAMLICFSEGLLQFTYYKTGFEEGRKMGSDLRGAFAGAEAQVMTIPPVGYVPEDDSYSNGQYAMYFWPQRSFTRTFVLSAEPEVLKNATKLRARYVSPLKDGFSESF